MKTELVIVSLSIMLLFTTYGSPVFVFSSSLPSASPSSSALSTNLSFNNNHQSLQPTPIVNAGANQVVTAGSTVILNGSNSRAPNGLILSYSWKQIPTDAQTTLSGVNTQVWEFTAPNVIANTLMRFQLNVTDNLGQVGTAFVNVLDRPVSFASVVPSPTEKLQTASAQSLPKAKTGNNDNVTIPQYTSSPNNNSKLLLISLDVAKNSISTGGEETIKIRVLDASNPNMTIAGARLIGIVADSTNATMTNFDGITDNLGVFTHTWKVSKDSKPGTFTVNVFAYATGYKSQLIPTKTTFNVNSAVVHEVVPERRTFNCRLLIISPGPCA
ncbi:MAG: hypothetical protein WAM42_09355 [Candidatus Nitrosopolaris sp.]